ncbi:MAG: hypothetical protein EB116_19980, partial [Betaproteobacteria bacterium]|nr:hypothetical protein [Betaproteobacteria bacterium]
MGNSLYGLPWPLARRLSLEQLRLYRFRNALAALVIGIYLLVTTVLGLVLAFRFSRSPWPVALCLVGGLAVPVLIL